MSDDPARRPNLATILFTDVVGSTALRTALGDVRADEAQAELDELISEAVERSSGWVVKTLGDGLLAGFSGATEALSAAADIQRAVARRHRRAATPDHVVKIGISAGDVAWIDDDCHGTPVVEAARLCDAAEGGQVLLADIVRMLAGSRTDLKLRPTGELDLKGLPGPTAVCELEWVSAPADRPSLPSGLGTHTSHIFVGRDEQMARLGEALDSARHGKGTVQFLTGEAGIGKSTLTAALAERALADGFLVLYGACTAHTGSPLQPLIAALRSHFAATEDHDIRLGPLSGELARLMPEVGERFEVGQAVIADPETERIRLLDAVAGCLRATATEDPLLLVLDDLHWAGPVTAAMVEHIGRTLSDAPISVIATYRSDEIDRDHPLSPVVSDLIRLTHVEHHPLSGLEEASIVELISKSAGHELDDMGLRFARALFDGTDGHPFFVRETLLHMVATGSMRQDERGFWTNETRISELGLSDGVRNMVRRRLDVLDDEATGILAVAAVAGESFDFDVLSAACEAGRESLATALDAAERAQLIRAEDSGALSYRFAHALVRAVLEDELTAVRRSQIHNGVGEALIALRSADRAGHASEIAHHLVEAGPLAKPGAAIRSSVRAGSVARQSAAFEESALWLERAVELDRTDSSSSLSRQAGLLSRLGLANHRSIRTDGRPARREASSRS